MPDKILLSWSGGKDSAMALERLMKLGGAQAAGLFTTYNRETGRVSLHGTPISLIRAQAESLGLPLHEIPLPPAAPNEVYEAMHLQLFRRLAETEGLDKVAYGDLFVTEIKEYRDGLSEKAGIPFTYPLWNEDPAKLANEVVRGGYRAVVISIDADKLPGSMLGRQYDESFIRDIPEGVDLCGENGEFHTFVWDGPIFKRTIIYAFGERYEEDYRPAVNMQMKFIELLDAMPEDK